MRPTPSRSFVARSCSRRSHSVSQVPKVKKEAKTEQQAQEKPVNEAIAA